MGPIKHKKRPTSADFGEPKARASEIWASGDMDPPQEKFEKYAF